MVFSRAILSNTILEELNEITNKVFILRVSLLLNFLVFCFVSSYLFELYILISSMQVDYGDQV